MILTLNKNAETQTTGVISGRKMSVSEKDMGKMMSMISEGLYKDKVGSTVREWVSNALDTHKAAGVNEPVIVTLERDSSYNWWFRVQDSGEGISPERQVNIVEKYGASTKEQDEEQLGAYGLGLKAGLSYAQKFTYVTRYNGIEYHYMMHKAAEGTDIALIRQQDTTLPNGTTFNIRVMDGDVREFTEKCRTQLAYFESVYFKVPGITNDFKIIKGDGWKFSTLSEDNYMHLCLDNVYYPIDFDKLGLDPIRFNVGLDFAIKDGLVPILSREDIQYTPTVIQLIKDKIKQVSEYFVTKYNESVVGKKTLKEVFERFNSSSFEVQGLRFNLNDIDRFSGVAVGVPSIEGCTKLNLRSLYAHRYKIFEHYRVGQTIRYSKLTRKTNIEIGTDIFSNSLIQHIYVDEEMRGVRIDYIKTLFDRVDFVSPTATKRKLGLKKGRWGTDEGYVELLALKKQPRNEWREAIKEYQKLEQDIIDAMPKYSSFIPTDEYLQKRKEGRKTADKRTITKEDINAKIPYKMPSRIWGFDTGTTWEISSLSKKGTFHVYGGADDKERLLQLGRVSGKVTSVLLSERDIKKLDKYNIHNFIKIEKFMEGKNRIFKKIITAHLIEGLMEKHEHVFDALDFIMGINIELAEEMTVMKKYTESNRNWVDAAILQDMVEIAKEFNLYDESVIDIYRKLEEKLPTFDFLKWLQVDKEEEQSIEIAKELLRYRKYRMDAHNYEPKPVPVENPIVEGEPVAPNEETPVI